MRWECERAVQLAPIMIIGIPVDEPNVKEAIEIGVSMSIVVVVVVVAIHCCYTVHHYQRGIKKCVDNELSFVER